MPKLDINRDLVETCNQERPLVLSKPILIEGKERDTLDWDAEKLTVEQYLEAATKATAQGKTMETDYTFHLWLGCELIVAADDSIDLVSLEQQLSAIDIVKVASLGRFFIMRSENLGDEDSGGQSESTPTSSTKPESPSEDQDSPGF